MISQPVFEGVCAYGYEVPVGGHQLLVAVSCWVEGLPGERAALLDTACPWCIMPGEAAAELGSAPVPGTDGIRLSSRMGTFVGWLDRFDLILKAESGEAVRIDATWFVCPDWPGPMVIGWKGGLERIRFAVDPGDERFYFGRP